MTLHGFCQAVLGTLGVAGDLDPDHTVVEEVDDLREQVVLDLYLRRFRRDRHVLFPRADSEREIHLLGRANPQDDARLGQPAESLELRGNTVGAWARAPAPDTSGPDR